MTMSDRFVIPGHFKIRLDFHKFPDWSIVRAPDSNGVVRNGLFLPFLQNGIRVTETMKPLMTFMCLRPMSARAMRTMGDRGELRMLIPYMPGEHWEDMKREGLARGDERDRTYIVGHAYDVDWELPKRESVVTDEQRGFNVSR